MMTNLRIGIKENSGKIFTIYFKKNSYKTANSEKVTITDVTALEKQCRAQLEEYFLGVRKKFEIPLRIEGTDFQKKVWLEMRKIPYGCTLTYKELAAKVGNPNAYRAVANACGANKLPIVIPCHRVVASNGLGGYSAGIEIKKKLLELEQIKK